MANQIWEEFEELEQFVFIQNLFLLWTDTLQFKEYKTTPTRKKKNTFSMIIFCLKHVIMFKVAETKELNTLM